MRVLSPVDPTLTSRTSSTSGADPLVAFAANRWNSSDVAALPPSDSPVEGTGVRVA